MQAAYSTSMLVFINKTTHHDTPEDCHMNCTFDIVCHTSGTEWKVKAGQGSQDPEDTNRKKKCNQYINALP